MDNIMKIFDAQDKEEMKNAFIEIIKEHFKTELEDMGVYLFDPNEIEEKINDAFSEVVKEIKVEFKEKLREQMAVFYDKKLSKILNGIK